MGNTESHRTQELFESMLPRGCIGCPRAKIAIHSLVELLDSEGITEENAQSQFEETFTACLGLQENPYSTRDDCMPELECGHPMGKCALSQMWQE